MAYAGVRVTGSFMTEEWRAVPGYEGYYEVSNLGRVRSVDRRVLNKNGSKRSFKGVVMSQQAHYKKYMMVWLRMSGSRQKMYVHRLVALAFHPNPEDKEMVNHKDKDRQNNHWMNLEWCTIEENTEHRDNYNPDEPF